MANDTSDITFIVSGREQPPSAAAESRSAPAGRPRGPTAAVPRGTVTRSVRVGARRGAAEKVRVTARPGEDVVVLSIVDGPTLVLNPIDARDLMHAQGAAPTRSAIAALGAADDVVVGAELGWPGLESAAARGTTRGWMGQAVLGAFHLVSGLPKDPAVTLATAAITKKVDGGVVEGVYELSPDSLAKLADRPERRRASVAPAAGGGPLLVFVHGAFVDTVSTFGKLWDQHAATVAQLFARYGSVYALDHATMGRSPIANALTLVDAMPPGARLHLVAHSRGGLVAEVLVRACNGGASGAEVERLFGAAGFEQHLADLRGLVLQAQQKGIRVDRVVRVACPARGTLLASKRLDAYLSILTWSLELAQVPVAPALLDFLHEVARRRADPAELPGLEAMMPGSPVVDWLNSRCDALAGDLRVVAGDMQGDSLMSWVKTLIADAFYWTDNDIVVQTRSMYGGAPRSGAAGTAAGSGALYVLERNGQTSHFTYFSNDRSVTAIANALLNDAPSGFQVIGPLSWAGTDASGSRAVPARSGAGAVLEPATRPAVFVLPGILGSNLAIDGHRIWLGLGFVNGLQRLAWDPSGAGGVESDGPIASVYGALIERLADSHEVVPFAFDWRRPIEDEAHRLADAIDARLAARVGSQQPVRIVAHSMGGLLARTLQIERPDTWRRMMARDGARLLMLGTPNAGSWSPLQTLSGDDTFGNALVAFGSLFDNRATRQLMADMPGFIELQAGLLDPALGLDRAGAWQKLADDDLARVVERSIWHDEGPQPTVYQWGAPSQRVLDLAVALRRRLDLQAGALGSDAAKMLLVVGHAPLTPCGFTLGADGLEYLESRGGGDGRVMLDSATLPGVKTWQVEATHGDLPSTAAAFAGYIELLQNGSTDLLGGMLAPTTPGASGDAGIGSTGASAGRSYGATVGGVGPEVDPALVRTRRSRGLQASEPPSAEADIFGLDTETLAAVALRVVVLNADLKFVRQPLLIGHYRSLLLTGTEAVVDGLVGHAMSQALAAGLYPNSPGAWQVFGNRRDDPANVFDRARPLASIVVGLGEEGKLKAADLSYSIRQGVLAYAQRLAERAEGGEPCAPSFEMAATLIGSGGTGMSVASSARQIVQGVLDANARLKEVGWPQLGELTLVELYLERATEAWHAMQLQQQATPGRLALVGHVQSGTGALRRSLDSSYRGSSYDFISATTVDMAAEQRCISYTLDTRRARAEVRAQRTQGSLLKELVLKASNDGNHDPLIGRTLFDLLIPAEMEVFMGGTTEMLIELDAGTAVIPWELLDSNPDPLSNDRRPWAIRSKLLRKLRVEEFRDPPTDAGTDDGVLVIGEPKTAYPPLPGARAEAIAVGKRLAEPDVGLAVGKLRLLVDDDDAQAVINALFEHPYRVIHIAGHGAPGANGGVVLSGDGTFLGAAEVRAMRVVPELVFLNCCHLAGRDASSALEVYDRSAFAANMAEELIRVGVRCVIAAGWAVEDAPAEIFATSFYGALLGGARFIDAVATARDAAWVANPDGHTWAAYQCYGDPDWRWTRQAQSRRSATPLAEKYFAIASPVMLALALENLATSSRHANQPTPESRQAALREVLWLEDHLDPLWRGMGAVAEAFGFAFDATGDIARSIAWYRRALEAQDGSASFRAAEQLGAQLVRHGATSADAEQGRLLLGEGVALLESLAALKTTFERSSLLGAAYKRLSTQAWGERRRDDAGRALGSAIDHYGRAAAMAREPAAPTRFQPLRDGIGCELRAAFLDRRAPALRADRLVSVRESLQRAASTQPDFWSAVGQAELIVLTALLAGDLASAAVDVAERLQGLKARAGAREPWASVYAEACFTLQPYRLLHAPGSTERRAANALLSTLRTFASA